jgi:hypothetical protein
MVPMASLTLKNLSAKTLARLRMLARRERRSLNRQTISLIEDGLQRRPPQSGPRVAAAQVAAWREVAGRWQSDLGVAQEIAAIYEARTGGRVVDL